MYGWRCKKLQKIQRLGDSCWELIFHLGLRGGGGRSRRGGEEEGEKK